jgi:para-nitrobenzyl esterase
LALGALLVLARGASAQSPPVQAPIDQVKIGQGALKGVVAGDVVAFKGIPYAAPPVGELRWRAPQAPAGWSGVRDATAFGPVCFQSGGLFGAGANQSEDCLTLNIWTPANHTGAKLPVMVWVHGGGFIGGSGSTPFYNGTAFAHDGVVLVSLNYRLGRMGWFAHPALAKADRGEPLGNYGLMDQIAALNWVRANIAAFGGDPRNITAFGESAGAISLNFLMASNVGKGLFDKVISESGFGRFDPPPIARMEQAGAAWAAAQGVTGDDAKALAALRALPASVLTGSIGGLQAPDVPRPMIDGTLIKERVDQSFARGHQLKIPYLLGGNSFEASLFAQPTSAHPGLMIASTGLDPAAATALFDDGDTVKAAFNISTETMITEPNRFLATKDSAAGARVWLYDFSYVTAAQRATAPGVPHGGELGYVFETLPLKPITFGTRTLAAATPEDLAVARTIHAYWVAFARAGDPDSAGGTPWPAFTPAHDALLDFTSEGPKVLTDFEKPRLDVLQARADTLMAAQP